MYHKSREPNLNPALIDYLAVRVSPRMRRIVDFVLDGRPTWDLCCDHGLIGLWAWHVRDLPELHFVDRTPEVIRELEDRIRDHMEHSALHFHPRDASTIKIADVPSNVILSGVGFRASQPILAGIDPSVAAHRLIICVHAESERIPPNLRERGWTLAREVTIEERGRTRTITAWDGLRNSASLRSGSAIV
jgi:tRNA (adenine22-N1)-methyltransferase